MDQSLRIGLIGAGRIGWPLEGRLGQSLSTHADAVWADPNCHLQAVIEPNRSNPIWLNRENVPVFENLSHALDEQKFDAFIIATPTTSRMKILQQLLDVDLKGVISEKPISCHGADSLEIVQRFDKKNIPFWVNLSRRFVKQYEELRDQFQNHERVISARIAYAKGIKHNGIHALDLAAMLFGEIRRCQVLDSRVDFEPQDPTLTLFAQFERCPQFVLQGLDHRVVTHFEIDIWTDKGRYIIDRDHTRLRRFEFHPRPTGEELMLELVETLFIDHHQSFANLLIDVSAGIRQGKEPAVKPKDVARLEILIDRLIGESCAKD